MRGEPSRVRPIEGAGYGLGLTLVRRIVEAHGGRVFARNAPAEAGGSGAEVGFDLPVSGGATRRVTIIWSRLRAKFLVVSGGIAWTFSSASRAVGATATTSSARRPAHAGMSWRLRSRRRRQSGRPRRRRPRKAPAGLAVRARRPQAAPGARDRLLPAPPFPARPRARPAGRSPGPASSGTVRSQGVDSAVSSAGAAVDDGSPGERKAGAEPSVEELMDQAKNYVCRSCSTPVPLSHKFCGRCGAAIPPEIMNARTQFFGQLQTPGKAKLILIRGEGVEGLSYQLNAEQHLVGRNGQLVFPDDPFVSPRHANLFYRNGKLVVRDEGSLNGVFWRVQGRHRGRARRSLPRRRAALSHRRVARGRTTGRRPTGRTSTRRPSTRRSSRSRSSSRAGPSGWPSARAAPCCRLGARAAT